MAYEVNSSGRTDPVPGTEPEDDDPDRRRHFGWISLEDILAPWAELDRLDQLERDEKAERAKRVEGTEGPEGGEG